MDKKSSLASLFLILSLTVVSFSSVNVAEAEVTNSYAWTTLQGDAQRTGFTESPSPNNNQTFWKFQTGGPITSSPAVVAGRVFVGSADGYLYAVNATTGTKLWAFWVGSEVNSPTVALDKVFITSASGTTFALDAGSGLQVWNKSLGGKGSMSPLVVGSRVFVGGNQTVYALNEAVGVRLYDEAIYHVTEIKRLIHVDGLVIAVGTSNTTLTRLSGFQVKNSYGRFSVTLTPRGVDRVTSFLTEETAKFSAFRRAQMVTAPSLA